MKQSRIRSCLYACMAMIIFGLCVWWNARTVSVSSSRPLREITVILDPGHGGEDGGAVAADGTRESDLNLELALRVRDMLLFLGESPLMTREEDRAIYSEGCITLREKKISDLKNRCTLIAAHPDATLVSIHQNTYPQPQYRGIQTFYAPTQDSDALASSLQQTFVRYLQPDNTRQEKPIPDSVYLLNHVPNRAVLVECGFLTNPEELSALKQEEYQRKLALVLSAALKS